MQTNMAMQNVQKNCKMQVHLEGMSQSFILEGHIFLKCLLDKTGSKETASTILPGGNLGLSIPGFFDFN